MPGYFGHEMSERDLACQVLADDLALVYVRAQSDGEREVVLADVKRGEIPADIWEATVARARRYVNGG